MESLIAGSPCTHPISAEKEVESQKLKEFVTKRRARLLADEDCQLLLQEEREKWECRGRDEDWALATENTSGIMWSMNDMADLNYILIRGKVLISLDNTARAIANCEEIHVLWEGLTSACGTCRTT
jgi:hypothetical protein